MLVRKTPLYILKIGHNGPNSQRLQVRNSCFELLGVCEASDQFALANLLQVAALPEGFSDYIATLLPGRLHPISL
jgi:hypothetical protein